MHKTIAIAMAASALSAAGQTVTITEQYRYVYAEAYAADLDGFIEEADLFESSELFNFNEDLFVEAELGGASAVAAASHASLLDPDFIQIDSTVFTEAMAEGPEADATTFVENYGMLTFTVDQPFKAVLSGTISFKGGESCQSDVFLIGGGENIIITVGAGETLVFSESYDLPAGEYCLVNSQAAEGDRKEEAISGDAVITLAIGAVCPADCNEDGELDILDFVCFQGLFVAADPAADCNGDDTLDILDFVCFQGLFVAGCD